VAGAKGRVLAVWFLSPFNFLKDPIKTKKKKRSKYAHIYKTRKKKRAGNERKKIGRRRRRRLMKIDED